MPNAALGQKAIDASRKKALRAILEKDLQTAVEQTATAHKWKWHHEVDSRRSKRGLPDLILVRGPRIIFAELKREQGRVSKDQQAWIEALHGTSVEVYIWRPSDMDDIIETLGRRP